MSRDTGSSSVLPVRYIGAPKMSRMRGPGPERVRLPQDGPPVVPVLCFPVPQVETWGMCWGLKPALRAGSASFAHCPDPPQSCHGDGSPRSAALR